ncbi:MAG: amino acid permease [Proteobacteria bacterium]|jgi:arginine:agmatine antiporter|nr:amino acid permease [Pseudomonadota bacterium]
MAKVGLFAAIFLIMNNMLGSGVFMLPATLASVGGISLIGWLIAMIGVIALALVFSKLAELVPGGAGPYDYARSAFGNFVAYQTNYVYSIASWIGNVSMISVVLGYLSNIYPIFGLPLNSAVTQIAIIWIFTFLNIKGAKIVSIIQACSLSLALIPLIFLATFGWHWFDYHVFISAWNVSHQSAANAVNSSFNNIMWAFIGVESACVSAALIKNPTRNIPLATIGGVIIATLLYIATCTVIMGIVPNAKLVQSSAPFADALENIWGHSAGVIISVCAIINCLGSLAGWTMVIGQTAKAAAHDGLFPKVFAKTNSKGIPAIGLIVLAFIMSVIVIATVSPSANQQFSKIITMSVILYLIPYIYSGFAVIIIGYKRLPRGAYLRNVFLGVVASTFCMWSILGSDKPITVWAFLVMMSCTFFYAFNKHKEHKEHKEIE